MDTAAEVNQFELGILACQYICFYVTKKSFLTCAIAILLTRRFSHALLVAVVVSVLVSLSGIYLSFFIDSAPAPTIVVLFALVFIVAMVISGRKTRQLERQRLNAS